ncbi:MULTISPECIES: YcjX family protein [Paracoccus]|uniref:YcjX family protein n=1 Tax=Paracoccus litorisediminis TaxID=2006130 RepID=A0A844HMC7_9RHOB|nr:MULTISPECIES: YcjX family protein [Paracoccus]MBD9526501.1 YcjX family protein [Paracoccus sp. PAR01]MTH58901.1 YcjX family protein [Paracoccus litorisediminis]
MGIADDLMQGLGISDPVIRLGVTGLSRAGKTVFITSLVANLLDRGRMGALRAAADGSLKAAWLQPQPDDTVPRFDYERHLAAMTGPDPHWPEGTRHVSQLRLSLRTQPRGLIAGWRGQQVVHLDIVDYPGEWLLDLRLMDREFDTWSAEVFDRMKGRPGEDAFRAALNGADRDNFNESAAQALAAAYTAHLHLARDAGWSDCTPGRFLMPGELEGSPALTFTPLPPEFRGSPLWREFSRRYGSYKSRVVKPFFRDHFARIDRQVVLMDVLGAIHAGPQAVEDMRRAMADILTAFRPGRAGWLAQLLGTHRVGRILFAATKADHLHHIQHPRLTAITGAMLREARDRADFSGARTEAMSIASLRTTTEETIRQNGEDLPAVRGTLMDGRQAAFYPGDLPANPAELLTHARQGGEHWLDGDYAIMDFAPAPNTIRPGDGPPHIRLDRAAEFLFGDQI